MKAKQQAQPNINSVPGVELNMRAIVPRPVVLAGIVLAGSVMLRAQPASGESAEELLKNYLDMGPTLQAADPLSGFPKSTRSVETERQQVRGRLDLEERLSQTPGVVAVVRTALPAITDTRQRFDLLMLLARHVPSRETADLFTDLFKDPNEDLRSQALFGLRMLASRIDPSGRRGTQPEPAHPPKVDGLVPVLISAAKDASPQIRGSALYALADTRDPQAIAELRLMLQDAGQDIRLTAACLLTEVRDCSGVSEMKEALHRLAQQGATQDPRFYLDAENLILGFERVTGKSFGEVPLHPALYSDAAKGRAASERYHQLLNTWVQWWNWTPSN
jgi:hypothetical protein